MSHKKVRQDQFKLLAATYNEGCGFLIGHKKGITMALYESTTMARMVGPDCRADALRAWAAADAEAEAAGQRRLAEANVQDTALVADEAGSLATGAAFAAEV